MSSKDSQRSTTTAEKKSFFSHLGASQKKMKLKEYRIPIPLSLDEYRLGQQWTEIELLKETFENCSTCLTIFEHSNDDERREIIEEKIPSTLKTNINSSTPLTHKKYNIKDQIPKFVEIFLLKNKNDLIFEEFCWDNWPYTLTIIENVDYQLKIIIQSYYRTTHFTDLYSQENLDAFYSITDEQMKILKDFEIINIAERLEEKEYRIDEDPTRIRLTKKPQLLPLELNNKWFDHWPKQQSSMCVYKLIELVTNDEKSFFNKATNKILWSTIVKAQKTIYHRFHQKMLCQLDQWIDRTFQRTQN